MRIHELQKKKAALVKGAIGGVNKEDAKGRRARPMKRRLIRRCLREADAESSTTMTSTEVEEVAASMMIREAAAALLKLRSRCCSASACRLVKNPLRFHAPQPRAAAPPVRMGTNLDHYSITWRPNPR